MPRRKTYKKIIEHNYNSFELFPFTTGDMRFVARSKQYYDKLGRLTQYSVLKDSDENYILCIRKHECPLFIDNTVKSYGSSCCNVGWYYYVSELEFEKLKYFCWNNYPDASELINNIQSRASIDCVERNSGKQIYAIAVFKIDEINPNKLISFFKPEAYSNKGTKEYIKNVFFRTVRYDYAQ